MIGTVLRLSDRKEAAQCVIGQRKGNRAGCVALTRSWAVTASDVGSVGIELLERQTRVGRGPSATLAEMSGFRRGANVRFWRISLKKAAAEIATSNGRGGSPLSQAITGADGGISLASLRRFWAVAARRNSSLAPLGPLRRSRSSFRMRLRWANSISTFFRSRRETT